MSQPRDANEAMEPKHCALSLIGEPVSYPRINDLVKELHVRGLSTFLVTNGQFPDAIAALAPVTQLYLSVVAPTKESMEALTRPIHTDFWERYMRSLEELSKKPGRRVLRFTLIEGRNMDKATIASYASMIAIARPDFIELKQLTPAFQGRAVSDQTLRLSNVPSWERILSFGEDLISAVRARSTDLLPYTIACSHEHSHCALLARRDYFVDSRWHTWIDFKRFADLMQQGCSAPLASDYRLPTPDWCLHGAATGGFDPQQVRHKSAKRRKREEGVGPTKEVAR